MSIKILLTKENLLHTHALVRREEARERREERRGEEKREMVIFQLFFF
jgi:hypothetical protein